MIDLMPIFLLNSVNIALKRILVLKSSTGLYIFMEHVLNRQFMKKFILLVLICFVAFSAETQSLSLSPDTAHAKFDPIFNDLKGTSEICNTSGKVVQFYWKFEKTTGVEACTPYLCDLNACYGPARTVCPTDAPNELMPGQCYPLDLHLNGMASQECCKFRLTTWVVGDTTDSVAAIYTFNCESTSTTNDDLIEQMSIFPNPTSDVFHIKNSDFVYGVEVVNMLGSSIREYDRPNTNTFDISDLKKGIYFVRLKDANDEVLKSIRLYKR